VLLLLAVAASAGAGSVSATAQPLVLRPGQAVAVVGTDVVCAFGGPANQIGIACLHTSQKAQAAFSFRLSENELLAFRKNSGKTVRIGSWRQPTSSYPEPRSRAVSRFKLAGSLRVGGRFVAAQTDLACTIYAFHSMTEVACFKTDSRGVPLDNSYAIALDKLGIQVSRFKDGHGTTVFVGRRRS
jgi:hypothetical protein